MGHYLQKIYSLSNFFWQRTLKMVSPADHETSLIFLRYFSYVLQVYRPRGISQLSSGPSCQWRTLFLKSQTLPILQKEAR